MQLVVLMKVGYIFVIYVTKFRYGRNECRGAIICSQLTNNPCGNYGMALSTSGISVTLLKDNKLCFT